MSTAARKRLARTLRGDEPTAFSVEVTAPAGSLKLEVEGFGPVKLPVTPAKARKLIGLGQPARFGRGEETLTDPEVRDTWEIPRHLVRAGWDEAMLKDVLAIVKEELGLPTRATLTAELHSLLVYEPDQFFLPHQDSEKDDSMIGTLVVTLPSRFTGGELVVGHNEEREAYQGSKTALSLVGFYADCRHEVLGVKSGYRITLTYNLLLHGNASRPEGDDGIVSEVADLLREHFGTPAPRYYGGPVTDPPNRLVYLLDHEYTARGLTWRRLKGADARRVSLLRAAAGQAGCEAVLALADVRTTHGAFPVHEKHDYWDLKNYWYDEDEDQAFGDASDGDYDIQDLVDSEVTLTHWTGPDGSRLEETSLRVNRTEVCASTPTGALTPYSSEYEGYMGNYGNTLDRWYHRAAVIVWPREQAFANRAEVSPTRALDEIAAMASAGDVPGARAAAATLAPFWDTALGGQAPEDRDEARRIFGSVLRVADAVADAPTAAMLLRPFRIDDLDHEHADSFGKMAGGYGQSWTAEMLRTWFAGKQPGWAYVGGPQRPRWIADQLPGLCSRLQASGQDGAVAAQSLVELAWEWTAKDIAAGLASPWASQREEMLGKLARPLASVLTAAAAIGAAGTRDAVCGFVRELPDAVTALEMPALRAAAKLPRRAARGEAGFGDLAADCAARLRVRIARPLRTAGDWSVDLPAGHCDCELCRTLRGFLEDKIRRTFEWPLAQERRQHVHARIDATELPVTHVTRRQGSPYILVLHKTEALFTRELQARNRDQTDLDWLTAQWLLTLD
jgi:2OG-Fe(II) oxygenase superfamily